MGEAKKRGTYEERLSKAKPEWDALYREKQARMSEVNRNIKTKISPHVALLAGRFAVILMPTNRKPNAKAQPTACRARMNST